mgnify:CR=1 FL=1
MSEITDEPGAGPLTPRGQEPVSIEQEMRKSYLDYAMSVSYTHLTLPTKRIV